MHTQPLSQYHQPDQQPPVNLTRLPRTIKPAVWAAIQRDKPALADLLSDPVAREINAIFRGSEWAVERHQLPESALAIIEGRS